MGINAPLAYEVKSNTISNTAEGISHADWSWSSGYVAQAEQAVISCHTNGIVFTYDGTTPTSTLGILLAAGERYTVKGNANILNISMIRSGGSDALVCVQLEKHS